jgi:ion channel-forming bestrophin family protein
MYIRRNFDLRGFINFTGFHVVWLSAYCFLAVYLYNDLGYTFLAIPWLPMSLIGVAVAFYVGFKNDASYERMWEARKIWGAIVNDSRSFTSAVKNLIEAGSPTDEQGVVKTLVYRHLAWLYTLRVQLLVPTAWEHSQARFLVGMVARKRRRKTFGLGLYNIEDHDKTLARLLEKKEIEDLHKFSNMATHILDRQVKSLKDLNNAGRLNNFRHMNMQNLIYNFYEHQGKCERIKHYPFPRQYASMSFIFVGIFIILLPFSLLSEFTNVGIHSVWLAVPFSVLASWVFLMMELVGDYSENPFEGLGNDIPMLAICRKIEIDLREMIGEEEVPEQIEPVGNVLM